MYSVSGDKAASLWYSCFKVWISDLETRNSEKYVRYVIQLLYTVVILLSVCKTKFYNYRYCTTCTDTYVIKPANEWPNTDITSFTRIFNSGN